MNHHEVVEMTDGTFRVHFPEGGSHGYVCDSARVFEYPTRELAEAFMEGLELGFTAGRKAGLNDAEDAIDAIA
jgi:hypothetical protein